LIAREFATCPIHLSVRLYFSVFGMPNTEKVSNGGNSGGLLLDGAVRNLRGGRLGSFCMRDGCFAAGSLEAAIEGQVWNFEGRVLVR